MFHCLPNVIETSPQCRDIIWKSIFLCPILLFCFKNFIHIYMLISNHQILSFYIVLVIIGFLRCRNIYACPFLWNLWISITCPKPFLFNIKNHKTSLVGRFGNYTWLSFMSDMQKLFCGIRKHYACILPVGTRTWIACFAEG